MWEGYGVLKQQKASFRLVLMVALLAIGLLMAACGKQEAKPAAPAAGQKITLKFYWTTVDGEKDPYAISARTFKELVEKKTQGKVDVKLYPNSQLGGDVRRRIDNREIVDHRGHLFPAVCI